MRIKVTSAAAIVFLALTYGCADSESPETKLDRADALLSSDGGNPTVRGKARDLYKEVLVEGNTVLHFRRAHFGVGMTNLLDLVHTALPAPTEEAAAEDEAEPVDPDQAVEDARALAPMLRQVGLALLDEGILKHWEILIQGPDFAFTFDKLTFEIGTENGSRTLDLSGEWDQTEIHLIYAVLQQAVAALEVAYAYSNLPETVLTLAFHPEPFPSLPWTAPEIPQWLAGIFETRNMTPPWADPSFGNLVAGGAEKLRSVQADRVVAGFDALAYGLAYLADEEDDQADDVFARNNYFANIVAAALPDEITAQAAAALIPAEGVREVAVRLSTSASSTTAAFLYPPFVNELLETAVDVLGVDLPPSPVCLGLPALYLGRFFEAPYESLTGSGGVFPLTGDANVFWHESEQETWTDGDEDGVVADGEFEDTGVGGFIDVDRDGAEDTSNTDGDRGAGNGKWDEPIALRGDDLCHNADFLAFLDADAPQAAAELPPLGHVTPASSDAPNGIVDPLYLAFATPSLNGMLAPIGYPSSPSPPTGAEARALDGEWTNGHMNRLLTTLLWFAGYGAERP